MTRQRLVAAIVLTAVLLGAVVLAAMERGDDPRDASPSTTTTGRASTSTTAAPTSTRAPTTTAAPTTTTPITGVPTAAPTPPVAPAADPPVVTAPPRVASTGLGAVRGHVIAIDPGHNGGNSAHAAEIGRPVFIGTQSRACDTTGTQTAGGYTESAFNLDLALRLRAVLQAAGATVVMSRTTDGGWGPCIDERAAFGNRAHAAVAISIHADGGPDGGRGFHVNLPAPVPGYTDDISAASHRLGVDVRDSYLATGMPTSTYFGAQGLVERSDLGGLNLSDVPKVMVETGNMRSATDAALLESADFRQRAAQALANGIGRFLAGG